LHKLYYDASKIRSAQKDIEAYEQYQEKLRTKAATGFTDKEDSEKSYRELEDRRLKAEAAQGTIKSFTEKNTEDSPVGKILRRVTPKDFEKTDTSDPQVVAPIPSEDGKINFRTDKYTWLDRNQRKLLSKVFGVIENVLAEDMASNLIAKIDESLKKK
jgi:molecular chaperone HtpG